MLLIRSASDKMFKDKTLLITGGTGTFGRNTVTSDESKVEG
jgi:FlaA1/EpsC-like NDP-sugar epimerase